MYEALLPIVGAMREKKIGISAFMTVFHCMVGIKMELSSKPDGFAVGFGRWLNVSAVYDKCSLPYFTPDMFQLSCKVFKSGEQIFMSLSLNVLKLKRLY